MHFDRPVTTVINDGMAVCHFTAMSIPCEILVETTDMALAQQLAHLAATETWRIEKKYSRYRDDGIIPLINNSGGKPVAVDDETAGLIDFAYRCYELSDGMFDITSGVLRKVWKFDGSDNIPDEQSVAALLPLIGLPKAHWKNNHFTLPQGMEIDLGGIGKEYAVDRVLDQLTQLSPLPMLVNFGGDIACNGTRSNNQPWRVGIENFHQPDKADYIVYITHGGIATSGDARRFLLKDGVRYGHILNPKTGWPIKNAPHSITVVAESCTQAGIYSTMAMLQGENAETFLENEGVQHWVT